MAFPDSHSETAATRLSSMCIQEVCPRDDSSSAVTTGTNVIEPRIRSNSQPTQPLTPDDAGNAASEDQRPILGADSEAYLRDVESRTSYAHVGRSCRSDPAYADAARRPRGLPRHRADPRNGTLDRRPSYTAAQFPERRRGRTHIR